MKSDRSSQLASIKLRGLLTEKLDAPAGSSIDVRAFGAGAAATVDGAGWVYVPNAPAGVLGSAVTWGVGESIDRVHVVVDEDPGALAWDATGFLEPQPTVWTAVGRSLERAEASRPRIPEPPDCPDLRAVLDEAGVEIVADHGVWLGEINGLEVARVGERGGLCSIDIGVGAYDQFASAAIGEDDVRSRLIEVAEMVRPHRHAGADPHPMGRLVRSRWLRAQALRAPAGLGLDSLEPIPLLSPRPGLSESQPAAALGRRDDCTVLVVFTVGVDVAISEVAAGLSAHHEPSEVLVVAPERDLHPRVCSAVERVAPTASTVALDGEWTN